MSPLLALHIAAGTLSVTSGAAALAVRKGGRAHRLAGLAFVASMLVMAVTAGALGVAVGEFGNVFAGVMAAYFVATAWLTVRRRDGLARALEVATFTAATGVAVVMTAGAVLSPPEPENPFIVPATFVVTGAVGLAAAGDLRVILGRGLAGAQRLARHLWRMCFALFIAVGSFAAQGSEVLPPATRAPALLGAMLLVAGVMVFWMVRVFATGGLIARPAGGRTDA